MNVFDGLFSRLDTIEEKESVSLKICQQKLSEQKSKEKKKEQNIQNNYKRYNIHIMGISEGEERDKETEEILEEIIAENFPKLTTDNKPQIQKYKRTPSRTNVKKPPTPRHIIFKFQKFKHKEKILKEARGRENLLTLPVKEQG